jgi:hypothetical protein
VTKDEVVVSPESANNKKKATLVNNRAPPQGSNMNRQMGMKKAKLLKKLEDAGVLSSTTTGLLSDSVSESRNTEEESMIANTLCYKRTCFGVEGCYVTQAG